MIECCDVTFSKYKRFFVFGCSFTHYKWPTWANILATEMPHAEFYNFGKSGGGNQYISNRLVEVNKRYKFNKDDLVIVMWTTFCREDRYVRNDWLTPGNIFTQNEYSDEFVSKYADTKGYLIRDLASMELASTYLSSLESDIITLISVPYDYQQEQSDESIQTILELYKDTIQLTPPCLFKLEMNEVWENGHSYHHPHWPNDSVTKDYHPNPLRYYQYLKKLGFNLTSTSKRFAIDANLKLKQTDTIDEIKNIWANINLPVTCF